MKCFTTFIWLLSALSVFAQDQVGLQDLEWLKGTWQVDKNTFEEWQITQEKLYGRSYILEENDTTILETIEIIKTSSDIYYIPTVKNQNNGKPVRFLLISQDPEQLVFENKAHDFPKRIIYSKKGRRKMLVRIEGDDKAAHFKMKRIS